MTSTIALVRHRVADFDAWKEVLRSIENPNDVTVTHAFESREGAGDFFAQPELKDAMSEVGFDADSVEISYFDEVESGALVGA